MTDTDDAELYKRLWYADRDGAVELGFDLRHFNKPESPTFDRKDNVLPILGTVCCTATAWLLGGWLWGLAIFASGVIFSLSTLNLWLMHRLRQRTLALARSGLDGWQGLWSYGGVSVRRKGAAAEVVSPEQDWRDFARSLPVAAVYEE
ncbi:MAG TPA: hypothetical protein VKA18_11255 [Alphaproteobacteria bacterium]|nr:hypothetical protein [Alphaproteobacteria bacterium]